MKSIVTKIVHLLRSVKLAAALIILLAVLCLVGILLPQVPAAFSASREGYAWWVDNAAYPQTGSFTNVFEALGFFHVFRSVWFIGTAMLLWLNILVCTLFRIKTVMHRMRKPQYGSNGKVLRSIFEIPSEKLSAADKVRSLVKKRHYTYQEIEDNGRIVISADKNRLSLFGTFAVHVSLLMLIIGILTGILFGFKNDQFIVPEGSVRDVGFRTGLSLYLESFQDAYWEDGTPKDYRSRVTLYQDGKQVKSGVVRVNHPMTYRGVRFHQGFFGPAAALRIADDRGDILMERNVALTGVATDAGIRRPQGYVSLPGSGYSIVVTGPSSDRDSVIGVDEIGLELYDGGQTMPGWLILKENQPQDLGGLALTYLGQSQYSGFQVSKDPGMAFIWIAAVLFLWGLGLVFYFPYRRIRVALLDLLDHKTRVSLEMDAKNEMGLQSEMDKIQNTLSHMNGERQ